MKRDLAELEAKEFDLIVIGGGIFGACAAWDATQRGLSVALIDRADFCNAASAQSFKLIHGGMRYLQHLDLWRVRQSSEARRRFLRLAPHLVHPLPIVVPTYGWGMKSRWAMRLAMTMYDTVTPDRSRGIPDQTRRIPAGRCLTRREVIEHYPGLRRTGLTGAAVFCDGQMYNPPRLVLAFIRTAVHAGAVAANYVQADRLTLQGNRVAGVEAADVLSGRKLNIRARCVLNAAGPYAEGLLESGLGRSLSRPLCWSRDSFFVVGRPLLKGRQAVALQSQTKDPDARLSRGGRHLFLVPWRDYTLVGVWHKVHTGDPDAFTLTEHELRVHLREINESYSGLDLTLDDVSVWYAGLIPFGDNRPDAQDLRFAHRSRLVDHSREHDVNGLVTLIGVRYTTSTCEAVHAVDLVQQKIGGKGHRSRLDSTPLEGGDFASFEAVVNRVLSEAPTSMARSTAEALTHNYGTGFGRVMEYARQAPDLMHTLGSTHVLRAEVAHAAREEMAQNLADVILRRTDLATGAPPNRETLEACADLMARELHWDGARKRQEVESVLATLPSPANCPRSAIASVSDR